MSDAQESNPTSAEASPPTKNPDLAAVTPPACAQDRKPDPAAAVPRALNDNWLSHFYRECGREVTLAFTTLNQMKNWAMVIVAAFMSAVAALIRQQQTTSDFELHPGVFVAAVVAYVFVLRFFIRSILCYINLVRWNTLQSSIVQCRLHELSPEDAISSAKKLETHLDDYYFGWMSPINRKSQLLSNLKLGFALLIILPLSFALLGAVSRWDLPLVRALAVFAIGDTFVEISDYLRSRYFDTPSVSRSRKASSVFPVPISGPWYMIAWILTLLASVIVASWPWLINILYALCGCTR